jgi:hypothetical protein
MKMERAHITIKKETHDRLKVVSSEFDIPIRQIADASINLYLNYLQNQQTQKSLKSLHP